MHHNQTPSISLGNQFGAAFETNISKANSAYLYFLDLVERKSSYQVLISQAKNAKFHYETAFQTMSYPKYSLRNGKADGILSQQLCNYGDVCEALDDTEAAIKKYEFAKSAFADGNPNACNRLGEIYLEQKKYSRAHAEFETAYQYYIDPQQQYHIEAANACRKLATIQQAQSTQDADEIDYCILRHIHTIKHYVQLLQNNTDLSLFKDDKENLQKSLDHLSGLKSKDIDINQYSELLSLKRRDLHAVINLVRDNDAARTRYLNACIDQTTLLGARVWHPRKNSFKNSFFPRSLGNGSLEKIVEDLGNDASEAIVKDEDNYRGYQNAINTIRGLCSELFSFFASSATTDSSATTGETKKFKLSPRQY